MASNPSFTRDDLAREIGLRGLTQEAFAEAAGVDSKTVSRALNGKRLNTRTFGKILIALGRIPVLGAGNAATEEVAS